mmetsp:Transcript_27022/g.82949  ORF Transcript_27022/g.82949 Transcript_27022/m.82949 type:complete len:366 (-) Transcript_27022:554-1651(-)
MQLLDAAAMREKYVETLDALIAKAEDDPLKKEFLREFQLHIRMGIRPIESDSIDDLHFALYEEWLLIRRKTPWMFPDEAARKVFCCHFKKSTEPRTVLEAECRAKGVEVKGSRFQLAALLEPALPSHCDKHKNKRPKDSSADDECDNVVYLRGKLERAGRTSTQLRGTWSTRQVADEKDASFHYWSNEDAFGSGTKRFAPFFGYFRVDERDRGVSEKNLQLAFTPTDGGYSIEGFGDNKFGAFKMTGSVTNDDLFLARHYVQIFDQTPIRWDQPVTPRKRGRPPATTPETVSVVPPPVPNESSSSFSRDTHGLLLLSEETPSNDNSHGLLSSAAETPPSAPPPPSNPGLLQAPPALPPLSHAPPS